MTVHVIQQQGLSNACSPFRVVEKTSGEIGWINRYLDQQRVRGGRFHIAQLCPRSASFCAVVGGHTSHPVPHPRVSDRVHTA